jgi:hypothetical protein
MAQRPQDRSAKRITQSRYGRRATDELRWNRRRHYRSSFDTLLGIGLRTAPMDYWTLIGRTAPIGGKTHSLLKFLRISHDAARDIHDDPDLVMSAP